MDSDSDKHKRGLNGQGGADYSSAAWRAGDLERQRQQSSGEESGLDGAGLLQSVFGFLGAYVGWYTRESWGFGWAAGIMIGFIGGLIVGGLMLRTRIGRYILGVLVVGIILLQLGAYYDVIPVDKLINYFKNY